MMLRWRVSEDGLVKISDCAELGIRVVSGSIMKTSLPPSVACGSERVLP